MSTVKVKNTNKGRFGHFTRRWFEKWAFAFSWAWRHTLMSLRLYEPVPSGIRIGASVVDAKVSIRIDMEDGTFVAMAMDKAGARTVISELQKAMSMVTYKHG